MSEPKTIKIDNVEYVRKDSRPPIEGDIKIVILQRGNVCVGYFKRIGNDCKVLKSSTIRRWGTTRGLGQLAAEGPTDKTVLDRDNGVVEFDYLTVIKTICCEDSKWKDVL